MGRKQRLFSSLAAALAAAFSGANSIVGWGNNVFGELNVPPDVHPTATHIAAGRDHCIALMADGTVRAWGLNTSNQTNVPGGLADVASIAAGGAHSIVIRTNGTLFAWGDNSSGQCVVPGINNATMVAAGDAHSLVARSDGTVLAWGRNAEGQCNVPSIVAVNAVAAGFAHSLALKSDGTVVAWGDNSFGQCTVPASLSGVIAIDANGNHSLALKSNGTVVAWGSNGFGESNVPPILSNVVAVKAGFLHSLALKSDGTLVAWGANTIGQLNIPAGLNRVQEIECGNHFNVVIKTNRPPSGVDVTAAIPAQGAITPVTFLSAISDPDGDACTAKWFLGNNQVGTGSSLQVDLPGGLSTYRYEVTDQWGLVKNTAWNVTATPYSATITFDNPFPISGKTYKATVALNRNAGPNGVLIPLQSSPAGLVTLPPSITVPSGQTTVDFDVVCNQIDSTGQTLIKIDESYVKGSASFTVNRPFVVNVNGPTTVVGGTTGRFAAVLNGFAGPSGLKVDIGSTNPALVDMGSSVNVASGKANAAFDVKALPVDVTTFNTVWAKLGGNLRIATFVISPAIAKTLTLAASEVVGGNSLAGNTLMLQGLAGPAGVEVTLTTSNPNLATVPPTLTIQPGKNLIGFKITTFAVGSDKNVTISATANGVTKNRVLLLHPPH